MRTKKWHNWNNLINHDTSINRGHSSPNTVLRSAKNSSPDKAVHHPGQHVTNEVRQKRFSLGDGRWGHKPHHFKDGYRVDPLMGDHPHHSLKGMY
jgi:hypothetical protein